MQISTFALLLAGAVTAKSTENAPRTLNRSSRSLNERSTLCNLAWSNSGHQGETDCSGADVVFSSVSGRYDSKVQDAIADDSVEVMCYISVGTVNPSNPILDFDELLNYKWVQNEDDNGNGGYWGDYWYNPDDLPAVLEIMKKVLDKVKGFGFTMVSTDNAKPSDVVAENDSIAARARQNQEIDDRYIDYMEGLVEYAHSIGLKIVLKNPSYYNNHDTAGLFDGYIVESLFNWYPYDINLYTTGTYGNLFEQGKPVWIFQYSGTNGVDDETLQKRMRCEQVPTVYLDTSDGWEALSQWSKTMTNDECRDEGMDRSLY
ncbi:hypothetical protein SARC_09088 [Sphaeroforma arctica JP610]|uniref:Glycoside-hydrolase family GH114 TIM-barrel domain-containing protein n=1 Tax=Sphaeroforma arctica JP610 TaxID=667725 RepID=A0A0L0FNS5_9EUKA|nr:hypothetical protein SARC_09088 [Sphaeroforma arctica JP610]KNC78485.1 hypothetical protein SARC_09088 [Sphaeroforma arctica JP610]|eukprot:XP_014152387.1 hypothetical protein SARC_09088 [Sphaeroforma arctica JP610]